MTVTTEATDREVREAMESIERESLLNRIIRGIVQ